MRELGALLLLCCMAAVAVAAMPRAALDRPNIVMLFVDDLGYGDVGFNGHPTTRTPNIDKLAFSGKILSSWYSGCPVCSGSRAALMTGRQVSDRSSCRSSRARAHYTARHGRACSALFLFHLIESHPPTTVHSSGNPRSLWPDSQRRPPFERDHGRATAP